LNKKELLLAPTLSKVMRQLGRDIKENISNADELIKNATHTLDQAGFVTDEIHIVDTQTLLPLTNKSAEAVILMAAFLRGTRLIDNQVTKLI
jgi:pantoate--beta-alanine ligase